MDPKVEKEINRKGFIFVLLHSIILINLTFDLMFLR